MFWNMIKMIAMDFDWTIVDHSKKNAKDRVGKNIIEILNRFIERGNYAGIVSGRAVWDFEREFGYMGIEWANPFPNYVIAREAYIYETKNNEYIEKKEYNLPVREKIMELNKKISSYFNDIFEMYKLEEIIVTNFFIYGDFAVEIHVKSEEAQRAMELMNKFIVKHNIKNAAVHRNGNMITIYNQIAGKGNTLLAAAELFGLKPGEVLAIGDNYNDISMIDGKLGFIGACVGNAEIGIKEIVKAGGGYIGKAAAYEGIIDVIKQLEYDGLIEAII